MNPKGLLTVVGSLDVAQFWPATKGTNSSDGDTVHLKVDPNTSFLFSPAPGVKPKITKKFIGAYVLDHGKKKRVVTAKNEIKIRLQGVDTPELHLPVIEAANPKKKGTFTNEFRQPFGAGAAAALHDFLMGFAGSGGGTVIHATFVTHIDNASQAIDSHGRLVGDILVGTANALSINTWLVEQGWAYPLFYDTMTDIEVRTLVQAWATGRARAARPGKAIEKALQPFDATKNINNAKLPDRGKLNYPKIFRRQASFWVAVPGALTPEEFKKRIDQGVKGKVDTAYPLDYFLKNRDKLSRKKRISLASRIGPKGETLFKPEELVFNEDPARLLDANGKPVKGS